MAEPSSRDSFEDTVEQGALNLVREELQRTRAALAEANSQLATSMHNSSKHNRQLQDTKLNEIVVGPCWMYQLHQQSKKGEQQFQDPSDYVWSKKLVMILDGAFHASDSVKSSWWTVAFESIVGIEVLSPSDVANLNTPDECKEHVFRFFSLQSGGKKQEQYTFGATSDADAAVAAVLSKAMGRPILIPDVEDSRSPAYLNLLETKVARQAKELEHGAVELRALQGELEARTGALKQALKELADAPQISDDQASKKPPQEAAAAAGEPGGRRRGSLVLRGGSEDTVAGPAWMLKLRDAKGGVFGRSTREWAKKLLIIADHSLCWCDSVHSGWSTIPLSVITFAEHLTAKESEELQVPIAGASRVFRIVAAGRDYIFAALEDGSDDAFVAAIRWTLNGEAPSFAATTSASTAGEVIALQCKVEKCEKEIEKALAENRSLQSSLDIREEELTSAREELDWRRDQAVLSQMPTTPGPQTIASNASPQEALSRSAYSSPKQTDSVGRGAHFSLTPCTMFKMQEVKGGLFSKGSTEWVRKVVMVADGSFCFADSVSAQWSTIPASSITAVEPLAVAAEKGLAGPPPAQCEGHVFRIDFVEGGKEQSHIFGATCCGDDAVLIATLREIKRSLTQQSACDPEASPPTKSASAGAAMPMSVAAYESRVDRLGKEVDSVRAELVAARAEIETRARGLEEKENALKSMHAGHADLLQKCTKANEEIERRDQKILQLQRDVENCNAEIGSLTSELETTKKGLAATIVDVQKRSKEIAALKLENSKLEEQMVSLKAHHEGSTADVAAMKAAAGRGAKQLAQELAEVKTQLAKICVEKQELEKNNNIAQNDIARLKLEMDSIKIQLDERTVQLRTAEAQLQRLSCDNTVQRLAEVHASMDKQKEELERLRALERHMGSVGQWADQPPPLPPGLSSEEARFRNIERDQMEKTIAKLEMELEKATKERDAREKEIEVLAGQAAASAQKAAVAERRMHAFEEKAKAFELRALRKVAQDGGGGVALGGGDSSVAGVAGPNDVYKEQQAARSHKTPERQKGADVVIAKAAFQQEMMEQGEYFSME